MAVIAVVVWVLGAPLAAASSDCMAMGAMCEGPCGASSCLTPGGPVSAVILATVAIVSPRAPEDFASAPLALADPPPRPALHSA